MAILTEQKVVPTGLNINLGAPTVGGDSFPNGGTQKIVARNTSGGSLSILVDAPGQSNFGIVNDVHDRTVTIPAAATVIAGPFETVRHNDTNGRVQLTYPGGITGLTIAILNQ